MDLHTKIHSENSDNALLASLGYKQELKRDFSVLQIFGISFSIIGVLPSIACAYFSCQSRLANTHPALCRFSSVLIYAIPNGGTSAMVWGVQILIHASQPA